VPRTCSWIITRLFKTVYPNGLQSYATPATTPLPSRRGSSGSLSSSATQSNAPSKSSTPKSGFFSRWIPFAPVTTVAAPGTMTNPPNGPVEELVLSGTAFGTPFLYFPAFSLNKKSRIWVIQPGAFSPTCEDQVCFQLRVIPPLNLDSTSGT
jgi:hypothetical protein